MTAKVILLGGFPAVQIKSTHAAKMPVGTRVYVMPYPDGAVENNQRILSPREVQVMRYTWEGLTAQEAATKMGGLSKRTVDSYVNSVLCKLGVTNKMQACRILLKRGVLEV